MTSLGKNICANKPGERVKGPGQELPVSAMAKMFDKNILSPKASGVASHVAVEDPGWVMGGRSLSWASQNRAEKPPLCPWRCMRSLNLGRVVRSPLGFQSLCPALLIACSQWHFPHSMPVPWWEQRPDLVLQNCHQLSLIHGTFLLTRTLCGGCGWGFRRQEPAAVSPADARAPAKHHQCVWELGRAGQRETARELGAMGGLNCSAPKHRHCFYPNLIHQLDKCSADSIGIKVTALSSQGTWGGPTFSWSTWNKVGGHFPLSLVMANPWNSALSLLFALLVLVNTPRSMFSCTATMPFCPGVLVVLFLSLNFPESVLCESFLTHGHIKGTPGPTPRDKHWTLCVCLCVTPSLGHGGSDPLETTSLCFLLRPPEEVVMCSKALLQGTAWGFQTLNNTFVLLFLFFCNMCRWIRSSRLEQWVLPLQLCITPCPIFYLYPSRTMVASGDTGTSQSKATGEKSFSLHFPVQFL